MAQQRWPASHQTQVEAGGGAQELALGGGGAGLLLDEAQHGVERGEVPRIIETEAPVVLRDADRGDVVAGEAGGETRVRFGDQVTCGEVISDCRLQVRGSVLWDDASTSLLPGVRRQVS